MSKKINVIYVPEDYSGNIDPIADKVEIDKEAEKPYFGHEYVPESGDNSVDRDFITDETKSRVLKSIADYERESAKSNPDPQVQLTSLEKAITYMWDVVSGEDIGSEAARKEE